MEWKKIDHLSWFQEITEDVYRVLIIQEYLDNPLQNNRSLRLKVMTVDVVKQEQKIKQLQKIYRGLLVGSALGKGEFTKPIMAKLYTLENSQGIVRVRKKDYKVLLSYIKNFYYLEVPNKEELFV